MKKINKLIKAIGLILKKPYLLNLVIDDNENWRKRIDREHGMAGGFEEMSFHELSEGREITVSPYAFMEGGSIPTDLALLKILAAKFDKCRYFEIGTWRGESVANVAQIANECVTMNLPASSMNTMSFPHEYIAQHAMYSKHLENVSHIEADSAEFDFAGLGKKFDLIFIDGDHHYEAVRRDTINVFKHLVHDKSIVVWHDYAWQPGEMRYETLAAILDGIPADKNNMLYAVRNTMCAVFYPYKIKSNPPSVVSRNDEAFEITLAKVK